MESFKDHLLLLSFTENEIILNGNSLIIWMNFFFFFRSSQSVGDSGFLILFKLPGSMVRKRNGSRFYSGWVRLLWALSRISRSNICDRFI